MKRCLPILAVLLLALPASAQLDRGFLSAAKRHRVGVVAAAVAATAPGYQSSVTNTGLAVTFLQKAVTNGGSDRMNFASVGCGSTLLQTVLAITNSSGQSFTKLWATNDANWTTSEGWYLINPTAGSNLVTVVFTPSAPTQSTIGIVNLTNVHQTTPVGTPLSRASATGNPTITVVSATGELVIGSACVDNSNTLATSGGTTVFNILHFSSDIDHGAATYAGAATVAADWTYSGGEPGFSIGAVSLKGP